MKRVKKKKKQNVEIIDEWETKNSKAISSERGEREWVKNNN